MRKGVVLPALVALLLTGCGSSSNPGLRTGEGGNKPVRLLAQQAGWMFRGGFQPAPGVPVSGQPEQMVFTLTPPAGDRVTGPMRLQFAMADMVMGLQNRQVQPVAGGSYQVPITFLMDGPWQVTVVVPTNRGTVQMVIPFVVH